MEDSSSKKTYEALHSEISSLRNELAALKTEKSVFEAQQKLLENFLAIARSPMKEGMLRTILKNTLEVSRELTDAEKGSIFLLDSNGVVTDSILTRKDAATAERSRLIGTVLDKGLAGWVSRHRRVGMIKDTENDDRWITLPDDNLGLVIADVCDKGVGAALFMAMFRSLIRIFSGHIPFFEEAGLGDSEPYAAALKAIGHTNDYISLNHGSMCMFATLFLGVLNPKTGELKYINGGHEPPAIVGPAGVKARLMPTGPAVGIMPNTQFEIQTARLEPGDIFIGYTDGVTEAFSPEGELFTRDRFESLLKHPCTCASDLLERIVAPLFSHISDAPRSDDITLLAVSRSPLSAS